jgi:hypothetical protein
LPLVQVDAGPSHPSGCTPSDPERTSVWETGYVISESDVALRK